MKTKSKLLKKTAQAVMIATLLCVAGMTKVVQAQPLTEWEQQQDYLFYLVYDDVQALQTQMPVGSKSIREEQLPPNEGAIGNWTYSRPNNAGWLGLAKNEMEGFQVFFREQEKNRNLRIGVSPFLNAQNEVLEHMIYHEEFKTKAL